MGAEEGVSRTIERVGMRGTVGGANERGGEICRADRCRSWDVRGNSVRGESAFLEEGASSERRRRGAVGERIGSGPRSGFRVNEPEASPLESTPVLACVFDSFDFWVRETVMRWFPECRLNATSILLHFR